MILPIPTAPVECIRFLRVFRRHQIVRRLEVAGIDLILLHEVDDVDRLRSFDRRGLEVFIRHDDELAFFVLVAFNDLVPWYRLAVCLADALVFHWREIFFVKQTEADVVSAHRSPQLDWDVDESECE
jgi:hypothetical protein